MAADVTSSYGYSQNWGFSPGPDAGLNTLWENMDTSANEVNVLLVGENDGRHILDIMSRAKYKANQSVNVYVVESHLEAFARQILLISSALEIDDELSLQERCEMFLEVFGNSLVRKITLDHITQKANEMIRWITDSDHLAKVNPVWNFSLLKYKERDQLESIFKFWRNGDPRTFDVAKCWEARLRQLLANRYDTRVNGYDWDYSMQLKDKANIISWEEYKRWRESGLAFCIRDESAYEFPNKTLASGLTMIKDGNQIQQRSYWGDMVNSPFLSYGVLSRNKELFAQRNGVNVKSATDVSAYNVISLLHKIRTGNDYAGEEAKIVDVIEEEHEQFEGYMSIPNLHIYPLPIGSLPAIATKSKFKMLFNLVYFSNSMVHNLKSELTPAFAKDCMIAVETTRYMVGLKDDLKQEYLKRISQMAESCSCSKVQSGWHKEKEAMAIFRYNGT